MGLYLRGNWYWFKKEIEKKKYYRSLRIRKGQEKLLSHRLKQVEEEILAEHYGLPYRKFENIRLSEYIEKYKQQKKDKKSLDRDLQRLDIIKEFWNDPLLSTITKKNVEDLENYLFKEGKSSTTVNRYFELIRHLLNLAIEDGYLKENPIKYYVPFVEEQKRRALSKEELASVLGAAKKISDKPLSDFQNYFYDLALFALQTGMRLSEILNLKRSYIKDDIIFYPYTGTKSRKRDHSQRKQFKIICLNAIAQDIISKQESRDEYVFPLHRRDENVVYWTVQRIRTLTGIQDFTFHMLRHTVSTFLASTTSLATAKAMLGHSDLKTTMKYTHPEIREQREGVTKLETFFQEIISK